MGFTSARERRLWIMAGSCLLLIYSSLYVARPLTEWLRDANLLRLAVGSSFLAAAAWIVLRLFRRRPGWRVWLTLVGIGAGYLALLSRLQLPEERLHFLEYGLIGGLVFTALAERQKNAGTGSAERPLGRDLVGPAVGAFLITGAAGWIDEGIQEILPNRFYDLRDVAMNAAAGAMAVFSIWILGLADQAGRRVEVGIGKDSEG